MPMESLMAEREHRFQSLVTAPESLMTPQYITFFCLTQSRGGQDGKLLPTESQIAERHLYNVDTTAARMPPNYMLPTPLHSRGRAGMASRCPRSR